VADIGAKGPSVSDHPHDPALAERDPALAEPDPALAERLQDPEFARAYDLWLLVLTQQAAEIELTRRGARLHRPPRARARRRVSPARNTASRTA
jgi:hypothetical protein